MRRQLDAAVANRDRSPGQVFGEKVEAGQHLQPLHVAAAHRRQVETLDRTKMLAFYKQRFSNAADFTFFMVGAFKVDEALPLLAQYVGSLPSTGSKASTFKDSASASRPDQKARRAEGARAAGADA